MQKSPRRAIFFDPNNLVGDDTSVVKPENLTIYVELQVIVPPQTFADENKGFIIQWTQEEGNDTYMASLYEGQKFGDGKFLTDYYADIDYNQSTYGQVKEALGIQTIDIEYNAMILPTCSIKFIDVLGLSVMNPMEKNQEMKGVKSFFLQLYTMPYPLFKLRIKGFYGRPVTYDLHQTDIRTTFNGETGYWEIMAKFVGYTWQFLQDIPFSCLLSAPYNEMIGKAHWEAQKDDRFKLSGQSCMTFAELEQGIANTSIEVERIQSDNENVQQLEMANSIQPLLSQLWADFDTVRTQLMAQNTEGAFDMPPQYFVFYCKEAQQQPGQPGVSTTPEILRAIKTFMDKLEDYNTNHPDHIISSPFTRTEDKTSVVWNQVKIATITSGEVGLPYFFDWLRTLEHANEQIIAGDDSDEQRIEQRMYYNAIPDMQKAATDSGRQYMVYVDYTQFKESLQAMGTTAAEQGADQGNYINDKITDSITRNVGFNPSMGNIVKIVFAHLETFMETFYSLIKNVEGRTHGKMGIDPKQTDVKGTGENLVLQPFFGILKNNEKQWSGELPEPLKYAETNYINSFIASVQAYNAAAQPTQGQEGYGGDDMIVLSPDNTWRPIHPFDIPQGIQMNSIYNGIYNGIHTSNPYNAIKGGNIFDLTIQIGIRMYWGLGLTSRVSETTYIDAIAEQEASNVAYAFGDNDEITGKLRSDNAVDTMYQVFMGGKGWEGYSYPLSLKKSQTHPSTLKGTGIGIGRYNMLPYNKGYALPFYSDTLLNYDNDLVEPMQGKFDWKTTKPLFYTNQYESTTYTKQQLNAWYSIREMDNHLLDYKIYIAQWQPELVRSWYTEAVQSKDQFETGKKAVYSTDLVFDNELPTSYSVGIEFVNAKQQHLNQYPKSPNNVMNISQNQFHLLLQENPTDISRYYPTIRPRNKPLFFHPLYYGQNLDTATVSVNEWPNLNSTFLIGEEGRKKKVACQKAYLFINQLDIDYNYINGIFTSNPATFNTPCIIRISRQHILALGSLMWRYNYGQKFRDKPFSDPIFLPDDDSKDLLKSSYDELPFDNTGTYTVHWGGADLDQLDNIFGNNANNNINVLLKKVIQNYFENWAVNEYAYDSSGKGGSIEEDLMLLSQDNKILNQKLFQEQQQKIKYPNVIIEKFNQTEFIKTLNDAFGNSIFKNYQYIVTPGFSDSTNIYKVIMDLFIRKNNPAIEKIRLLFGQDILLFCSVPINKSLINYSTLLSVPQETIKSYLTTFVSKFKAALLAKTDVQGSTSPDVTAAQQENIDQNRALYYMFKNLYDKWCKSFDVKHFQIENYYKDATEQQPNTVSQVQQSFNIIDKFYEDISQEYIANLSVVGEILQKCKSIGYHYSLLDFLSELFSKHSMLFIPTPHGFNFNEEKNLKEVFTPHSLYAKDSGQREPIWTMDMIQVKKDEGQHPCYTAILTGEPASVPETTDGFYKKDSADFSDSKLPDVRYPNGKAYPLPCFAVQYGKQNQSFFKITSMSNAKPQVTEQSINAMFNLVERGEGVNQMNQGGDIYSIYSNMSYIVDLEMMGCAQIQPLMYFQIMNTHLFSGAYMIFKMSHQISQGKMTTRFSGMKMSNQYPSISKRAFNFQTASGALAASFGLSLGNMGAQGEFKQLQSGGKSLVDYGRDAWIIKAGDQVLGDAYNPMEPLSTYFNLGDFVKGTGINGKDMPLLVKQNLWHLQGQLNGAQEWVKKQNPASTISINSGWRPHKSIGKNGPFASFHNVGSAADFQIITKGDKGAVKDTNMMDQLVLRLYDDKKGKYTELYRESSGAPGSLWIHYCINNNDLNSQNPKHDYNFNMKGSGSSTKQG